MMAYTDRDKSWHLAWPFSHLTLQVVEAHESIQKAIDSRLRWMSDIV